MDMVESVNGMPKSAAARAAKISPSACAFRLARSVRWPEAKSDLFTQHGCFGGAVGHIHRYTLAKGDFLKSSQLARKVVSVQEPDSIIIKHGGYPLMGNLS